MVLVYRLAICEKKKKRKGKLRFVYKGAAESGKRGKRKISFCFLLV